MKAEPTYNTPVGNVSPETVAAIAHAAPAFVVAASLVYGVLEHGIELPSSLGTALWVGGIVAIVTVGSIRSYYQKWGESP